MNVSHDCTCENRTFSGESCSLMLSGGLIFFSFRITSSTLEKQPYVSVSSFYSFISIGKKKVQRDEIKNRLKSSGEAPLRC